MMDLSGILNTSLHHRLPVTCFYPQTIVLRIVNLSLGYFANSIVIFVILASRSLWNPRNLFWLAVFWADIVIAIYHSVELVSLYSQSNVLCRIGAAFLSVPFASLLSILTLAAVDRHWAIQKPFWHRSHVTNTRVLLGILITLLFVVTAITAPYWSGLLPLDCVVHVFHHQVIWLVMGVLSIICIALHLTVYCGVRRRWREATRLFHTNVNHPYEGCRLKEVGVTRSLATQRFYSFRPVPTIEPHQQATEVTVPSRSPSQGYVCSGNSLVFTHHPNGCFPVLCPSVSQLEMRAAVNITLGMIPFWIFTLPTVGNFIGFFFCNQDEAFRCDTLCVLTGYGKDFYLLHCLYNPFVYVIRSSEFHLACQRLARKLRFLHGR